MAKNFNYAVGHYIKPNEDGYVCTYMSNSCEIFYGTRKEAEWYLEYVKRASPEDDWKIFKLKELKPRSG